MRACPSAAGARTRSCYCGLIGAADGELPEKGSGGRSECRNARAATGKHARRGSSLELTGGPRDQLDGLIKRCEDLVPGQPGEWDQLVSFGVNRC